MKIEDFQRMWNCYGLPRYLRVQNSYSISDLREDRKVFKKSTKQKSAACLDEISKMKIEFEKVRTIKTIEDIEGTFEVFSSLQFRFEDQIKICDKINEHQLILAKSPSDFSELKITYRQFQDYFVLWQTGATFESSKNKWKTEKLKKLSKKEILDIFESTQDTLDRLEREVFKKDNVNPNTVIQLIREKIAEFEPTMPLLTDLTNPDMKSNQVAELAKAIGLEIPSDMMISLNELIEMGIEDHLEAIADRSLYATGQKKLFAVF